MPNEPENPVPKVHPLTRGTEADDPMEVVAQPVFGDPEFMLQCMVEELAWSGFGTEQILELFHSPEYPVLNQLLAHFGEDWTRTRVFGLLGPYSGVSFSAVVDETPDPDADDGPELIQLTIRQATDGQS